MVEVVERERLEGGLRGDFVRVFLCACVSLIAFLSRSERSIIKYNEDVDRD